MLRITKYAYHRALGMVGIGKTTLARAAFNQFSSRFDGCCFLENVREESKKHGLPYLKAMLFSELFDIEDSQVHHFLKNKLPKKMVLIVLDDVDNIEQLEGLIGDRNRFSPGSKIIVTTRDAQLLKRDADKIYQVEPLYFEEALEIFYLNAFERKPFEPHYIQLSKEIVNYIGGNPLALRVLGSFLHSGTIQDWESALNKLKIVPHPDIQKMLKISYDGLDDMEKDILLDIACFFKGEKRDFVESMSDGPDLFARTGIKVLIDKSLINIKYDDTVWMHDLIQEMCWEIVRQQAVKEPEKRSRLWIPQDVCHVLENNEGTEAIEGIYLDMSKMNEDLHLIPTVFKKMNNLRLLKICISNYSHHNKFQVFLNQGLQFLPHSLKYLCWCKYPSNSLPSNYEGKNVVQLDMPYSKLTQVWSGVQTLENVKRINLGHSKQLIKLPYLSQLPKLESINLEDCTSLVEVPPLNFQKRFGSLTLRGCTNIKSIPKISGNLTYLNMAGTAVKQLPSSIGSFEKLVELDLFNCQHIKNLPVLPRNIEVLNLSGTSIKQVPSSSIEDLHRLRELDLARCGKLESLPTNIFERKYLEFLDLNNCSRLKRFTGANLEGVDIQMLSNTSSFMLEKLFGLRRQDMSWRGKLAFIPNWIYNLSSLKFLSCHDRRLKLEHLQLRLFSSFPFKRLYLYSCNIVEIPDRLGLLSSLTHIDLGGNPFERLPSSIIQLHRLERLYVRNCKKLRSLPPLPLSMNKLNASGCASLETISSSSSRFTLRHLTGNALGYCPKEFLFTKCWKLEQNARNELTDFLYEVEESMAQQGFFSTINVCYPGNEIPKWFSHQVEGDSVSMKLSKDWNNSNFLGFVICFVATLIPASFRFSEKDRVDIDFELHLKTKSGEIQKHRLHNGNLLIDHFKWVSDEGEDSKITTSGVNSDHVFISYCKDHNPRRYCDARDASLNFKYRVRRNGRFEQVGSWSCRLNVKRIGVGLLYEKKGEE